MSKSGPHKKVVLFGAGQSAEVAYSYLKYSSAYEVAAFTVDRAYVSAVSFFGLPLVAFEEVENAFPPSDYDMLIFMSYRGMNKVREKKYLEAKNKGYALIRYISPRSTVFPNVSIGDNCMIMDNVTLQPHCTIGNNVIVLTGAVVGHHCIVHDHCYLAAQSILASTVVAGERSFFGMHSTVAEGVQVAHDTLVGAAAMIHRNTVPKGVYMIQSTKLFPKRSDEFGQMFKSSAFS